MRILGNLIWLVFGGLFTALLLVIIGLFLYITIIGIPLANQLFKFANLMLTPFGQDVDVNFGRYPIINTIWIIFIGVWLAIGFIIIGVLYLITIIGIPFGLQWFKFAKLALIPFGAIVR